jgi:nucleoside-diphosphate-sugar epimerase
MEGVARILRRRTPPPFTRYGVRLMASDCGYDNRKAEHALGFRPTVSFRQGLAAMAGHL